MEEGQVRLEVSGPAAFVIYDRPQARNAMTKAMYADLKRICDQIGADPRLKVAVFRGAGGKAFVAGSDIAMFSSFKDGRDGVAYEAEMEIYVRAVADIPFPTIAVVEGVAVGGGLTLAAACDIRIATPEARFGTPIARTVGNCLSIRNYARLLAEFGPARAKRMLMLGELLEAQEARDCGFLAEIVPPERLDERVAALVERILGHAPLTLKVSKEAIRRIQAVEAMAEAEDLIETIYGSRDFAAGVAAFRAKSVPEWTGR